MKKAILIFLIFLNFSVNAQSVPGPATYPVKGLLMSVKDWGSRSIMILNAFFEETKDSIISQIGEEEFDEMKSNCSSSGWPQGVYSSGMSDEDEVAFDRKLNELKMYRIASYTHKYNGKIFDRYVIVRVPFEENKNWNPSIQWKGNIYFLLKEKDIELI
ncbi:MAG: hypothetical protein IPP39_13155 [Chitinophagaceae bacterium]|nr:hypothetical protein [Chitinophagaceae bacterium]